MTEMTEKIEQEVIDTTIRFIKGALIPRVPFGIHTIILTHEEERQDLLLRVTYVQVEFSYNSDIESKDCEIKIKNITPISHSQYLEFIHKDRGITTIL